MIGKLDPRLNLTSPRVITRNENVHDLACLVILVTLALFIAGFLCVVCKIYEDDENQIDTAEDTVVFRRRKSKITKHAKAKKHSRSPKVPNNTPIQSSNPSLI